MADITLAQLSNSTDTDLGTGAFDVLIQSVLRHIKKEYTEGRITGPDYANVYLGSMQATLSEAVKFLLQEQQAGLQADLIAEQVTSEQKNNEPGGLIDLEKQKLQAQIDLIIAQTSETGAKEALTDAQTSKVGSEELHNRFLAIGKLDKELGFNVTYDVTGTISAITTSNDGLIDEQIIKAQEEVDLLQSRDLEQIAATARQTAESDQKIKLMKQQTLGFSSDTKLKALKQAFEGYGIAATTDGSLGNVGTPSYSVATGIETLLADILNDLPADPNA